MKIVTLFVTITVTKSVTILKSQVVDYQIFTEVRVTICYGCFCCKLLIISALGGVVTKKIVTLFSK